MQDFSHVLFVMIGAASGAGLVTMACLAVLQEFGPASKREVAKKAAAKVVDVPMASIITGPEPRSKQGTAYFALKGPATMSASLSMHDVTATKAVFPTLMPTGSVTASLYDQMIGAHAAAPGTDGARNRAPEPSEEETEE